MSSYRKSWCTDELSRAVVGQLLHLATIAATRHWPSAWCVLRHLQALIMTGPGCYRTFLEAVCNSTHNTSSLAAPLFGLVHRCIGVNASCDALSAAGSLLPPDLEARALNSTAGSSNTSTIAGVVNSLSPPDPFQLVPHGESGSPVVLATPDEIAQVGRWCLMVVCT